MSGVSLLLIRRHDAHLLHGSPFCKSSQLIALAKIRAIVVFPIPRGPLNIYACDVLLLINAFLKFY